MIRTSLWPAGIAMIGDGVTAAAVLMSLAAASTQAASAQAPKSDHSKSIEAADKAPAAQPVAPRANGSLAQQYCEAIHDMAVEARYAFQKSQLEAISAQIDEKVKKLEVRAGELKELLAKREAFVKQASAQLVGIYSAMRPESASEQMVRLNASVAAAILSQMDQRAASAILNDMPPDKAAKLTSVIFETTRKTPAGGGP